MTVDRRKRPLAGNVAVALAGLVTMGLIVAGLFAFGVFGQGKPTPPRERCVAAAHNQSTEVDFAQAHYASIIAGLSVRRGLPARAATIALTAAVTESDLHNLDHGDRDSYGLFQQRPSQGWGPRKKIMDPYYATNRFYDHLIKIKHWKSADVGTTAQRVQRSGDPSAYPEHEETGTSLASALTGHSRTGIRCLIRHRKSGDSRGLARSLRKTYRIEAKRSKTRIVIRARSARSARSYAAYAIANARNHGLASAQVGSRRWTPSKHRLARWHHARHPTGDRTVRLVVRS